MYIRMETLSMKLLRILKNQLKNSWFLFAFIIVALILWNTNRLFQNLSVEQRTKMELLQIDTELPKNKLLDYIIHKVGRATKTYQN